MTLIPAEEWQTEFWERCARTYWKDPEVQKRGHGTETECAVIRDIQRNALEAAAKAVCNCGRCKSRGERRAADCLAEGIWGLYHGIPAPAGNVAKEANDR